ncbi:glycosyltransferase [Enterococcus hulanensis]|uniref:Glycosyltransferase n=1 Tax=Enterococcus hulanensis TaxID=2559929 RepID=A0ABU3EWM5_9ENTE|nr:glycosyltransferase [Enterococcus hulanensis]MDT2599274.1 glycosyltransferase [Enterococcus hulanensis]MDT2608681.1 glycosyltransferase [Enterococcus hulanensis]MDT2616436.1 glycosyltransferase [Enterococcus hulanensis]MDT2627524.1 glycosyltransferase [Enterococcus hulanensis]MDT2655554.1 glycosyltransferase [Enterococcus hulanensis]
MKYDFDLSLEEHTSVGKIISQITDGSSVLEFGPGNGRMTQYLINEKKCEVSIVEFDPVLFEHVMGFAQDGFLGNIEEYKWNEHFAGKKFDFIIFADVLEHLTDSEKALEEASKYLAPNGEILLTFPNLAHNSVLIDLFNNKLDWKQYGLLDRTHNSFYTQQGFEELFERIGLSIRREDFTYSQVGQNELSASYEELPEMVRYDFKNRPFGEVYQYFYALRKETVEHPERVEPINSNYNKQMQLAYLINDKFEVEPYIFNNQTNENKTMVHQAPASTEKLRIVVGKVPASIQLSVVVDNKLLKIEETNASWYQEDLFMFPDVTEEPYVVIDGAAVAGKEYTVNVNVLNEEEFFPSEVKVMDDVASEKEKNRLLQLKLNYFDKFDYQLKNIPYVEANAEIEGIKLTIESIENNESENEAIIKGWGFSEATKLPLDYLLAESMNPLQVNLIYRPDVNEVFGIDSTEKFGFILTAKDMQVSDAVKLLVLDHQDQVYPIIAKNSQSASTPVTRKIRHLLGSIKRNGFSGAVKNYQRSKQQSANYEEWMTKVEEPTRAQLIEASKDLTFQPKISLVVPVYNVDEKWLRACVKSLTDQVYSNWELCLADDASPKAHIKPLLEELAAADERVKIVLREKNGHISEATNSAIEITTGDYIGFMDNDDILADTALLAVVNALNENQNREFIYTDEDKLSMSGKRFDPFFKPNWNETLLLGHNYITHFVVVKRSIVETVGGLRTEFNGSQDYDFVLRATEAAKEIHHVSNILYHWRTIETSVAMDPQSKEYAYVAGQNAVQAALERRKLDGVVSMTKNYGAYKIDFKYETEPKVSIILSDKPSEKQLKQLLATSWNEFEILVSSTEIKDARIRAFAGKNENELAREAAGEFLVFLTAELVPTENTWLQEAMNFVRLPNVGAVAGKVISKDDAILNCGVIIDPAHERVVYEQQGLSNKTIGTYFRPALPREIYTATEDVLILQKDAFLTLGGFDMELPAEIKGIDFSIRLAKENKKLIFDPYFEVRYSGENHFNIKKEAYEALTNKYSQELNDPLINPNQFSIGG